MYVQPYKCYHIFEGKLVEILEKEGGPHMGFRAGTDSDAEHKHFFLKSHKNTMSSFF